MLTREKIDELARTWFQRTTERIDTHQAGGEPRTGAEVEKNRQECQTKIASLQANLAANDFTSMFGFVDGLLTQEGISIDRGDASYKLLCRTTTRAFLEAHRHVAARLDGRYDYEPVDLLFKHAPRNIGDPTLNPLGGPTLFDLVKQYLKANRGVWTEQTLDQNSVSLGMFQEVVSDKPSGAIVRSDVSKFIENLSRLPKAHGRSRRSPKSILKVIAESEKSGRALTVLSQKTINRHVAAVSGMFTWARKHGKLTGENPAGGFIDKRRATASSRQRRPWLIDELERLFRLSWWSVGAPRNADFFAPFIALYSGMRLDEICKLIVEDFREADAGIWAMDVTDNAQGRVKEESSKRTVPVHPELLKIGLIDHVKAVGSGPIWPELKRGGRDNKLSASLSKRFGRLKLKALRKIGPKDPLIDFHSFRKNVATSLHGAGVPESTTSDILGHEHRSESYRRYSTGPAVRTLYDAICKVNYDLDLSRFYFERKER